MIKVLTNVKSGNLKNNIINTPCKLTSKILVLKMPQSTRRCHLGGKPGKPVSRNFMQTCRRCATESQKRQKLFRICSDVLRQSCVSRVRQLIRISKLIRLRLSFQEIKANTRCTRSKISSIVLPRHSNRSNVFVFHRGVKHFPIDSVWLSLAYSVIPYPL